MFAKFGFSFFCLKIQSVCSRSEQAWSLSNHATKRFKLGVEIKHLNLGCKIEGFKSVVHQSNILAIFF